MEFSKSLPLQFWLGLIIMIGIGIRFWMDRKRGYGIPGLAVIGTLAVWYFGDAVYNDYDIYLLRFSTEVLSAAWWQVVLFLGAFCILVPLVHSRMNRSLLKQSSEVVRFIESRRSELPGFQLVISKFFILLLLSWVILMTVALVRVEFDYKGLFFPWLALKTDPWERDRIGTGFDSLLSLAQYFQVFLTAAFGTVAALSKTPRTRTLAILVCLVAFPYFLFDRTRNTMIATLVPGILAWVFLRLRGNALVKTTILLLAFIAVESWFSFVIERRTTSSISAVFVQRDVDTDNNAPEDSGNSKKSSKHLGLNMFEELAWINSFINTGHYTPNWGERYFAEIVNPIPRVLWPEKPMIGIDYAIARGFGGARKSGAGVHASISTGMIGQGVVNFGRFFGPITSALLLALWVALLARQDLLAQAEPIRLLLYGLGLVLTFNMGRDITLLVLYPFLFGLGLFWIWKKFSRNRKIGRPPGVQHVERPANVSRRSHLR